MQQGNIIMRQLSAIIFTLIFCFCFTSTIYAKTKPFSERSDVKSFVDHMVKTHQFDKKQLNTWFNEVVIQKEVLAKIAKPAEALQWYQYEPIFLTPERVAAGTKFWQENAETLQKAAKIYGVSPEIIVAILGVETFYGQRSGKYGVFDSLATLAFEYPPRAKFFRSELESFLLLARKEKWDPKAIKGSYAGAMGYPQFIASSYHKFGIDFDENGQCDLLNNTEDTIGSIAHYFKQNGWEPHKPVAFKAHVSGETFKKAIASKQNPKPSHTLSELVALGIKPVLPLPLKTYGQMPMALIALDNKEGKEYWLGTQNFYAITRYNHSDMYAMAVYLLSEQVKAEYGKLPALPAPPLKGIAS